MDYWFPAIFPSGESLSGNMGMNAWLEKSNCHSSFLSFSLLSFITDRWQVKAATVHSFVFPPSIITQSLLPLWKHLHLINLCICWYLSSSLFNFALRSISHLTPLSLSDLLNLSFPLSLHASLPLPLFPSLTPSPHPSFLNSPALCTINQLPLPPSLHPSLNPLVPSVVPLSPDFLQSSPSSPFLF